MSVRDPAFRRRKEQAILKSVDAAAGIYKCFKKRKSLHTYLKEMYTEQNMVPIYFRVELTLFRI